MSTLAPGPGSVQIPELIQATHPIELVREERFALVRGVELFATMDEGPMGKIDEKALAVLTEKVRERMTEGRFPMVIVRHDDDGGDIPPQESIGRVIGPIEVRVSEFSGRPTMFGDLEFERGQFEQFVRPNRFPRRSAEFIREGDGDDAPWWMMAVALIARQTPRADLRDLFVFAGSNKPTAIIDPALVAPALFAADDGGKAMPAATLETIAGSITALNTRFDGLETKFTEFALHDPEEDKKKSGDKAPNAHEETEEEKKKRLEKEKAEGGVHNADETEEEKKKREQEEKAANSFDLTNPAVSAKFAEMRQHDESQAKEIHTLRTELGTLQSTAREKERRTEITALYTAGLDIDIEVETAVVAKMSDEDYGAHKTRIEKSYRMRAGPAIVNAGPGVIQLAQGTAAADADQLRKFSDVAAKVTTETQRRMILPENSHRSQHEVYAEVATEMGLNLSQSRATG